MLSFFKKIAFLEGLSLLLLIFFAMPMKYVLEQKIYVQIIGMAHGILFIAYILLALILKFTKKWNAKLILIACLASLIPFGTFYLEKKHL